MRFPHGSRRTGRSCGNADKLNTYRNSAGLDEEDKGFG
jgi:hypothetical protein